jgi:hypothetical protein
MAGPFSFVPLELALSPMMGLAIGIEFAAWWLFNALMTSRG